MPNISSWQAGRTPLVAIPDMLANFTIFANQNFSLPVNSPLPVNIEFGNGSGFDVTDVSIELTNIDAGISVISANPFSVGTMPNGLANIAPFTVTLSSDIPLTATAVMTGTANGGPVIFSAPILFQGISVAVSGQG